MKKFLLSVFALLMTVSGAWAADNLPASTWNISSALPTDSWVAMGENTPAGVTALGSYTAYYRTQEVTLETAGMIDINFLYSSGNHRLEILGVDALNGSNEVVASDYHCGYTGTNKSVNDYFLNNLSAGTYTLRYIINSGVSSSVGNITIRKFDADVVSALPQLTTDVNNPKYYSIASYNRGGYLTSNGADQAMTHVAFAAGSSWYFTAINGNNSGTVIGGVIAHCSDGTQMKQNWQTAASGQTIYILPNTYNIDGFCLSKTLPISSNSCCDANNYNTGLGNWYPHWDGTKDDWQGTTWVFNPTVPIDQTGYYYFKGMAIDRHPYLYSDFIGKSTNATYHHDLPGSPSNGHIWKVTNNGTTFTATNGEGLPVTIGSTTYETLTLSAASAGPVYYFTEAINLTNWGDENGNEQQLTTWAGHPDANDNKWTFELADVSAGVYDVVVQGNDDGYVTYSGQNAKNGGFFVAASIAVGDLTAKAIDGYTTSVSISDRTITVSYNKQLSYTLTDANGATYSWSALGAYGVTPAIEGCDGYSLSNEVWNEGSYSYTADITFPFAVSSNSIDNFTFLGQFNNKNGYSASEFLWHAKTVNETPSIIIHSGDLPTTDDADQDKYLWSIIPAFSDGAFTFTIKNKSTGTYVNSTYTENRHNVGDVTLSETATPMTYKAAGSTGTCNPINAWYLPSTEKYLSANSINNGVNAVLGVYGIVHDGISVGFPTYGDLSSIYWRFKGIAAEIAKAGQYGYPSTTNEYTVALNGVKTAIDGNSYPSTKDGYNNILTWYASFLAADAVLPTAGFYRIKASAKQIASQPYLIGENHGTQTTRAAFSDSPTGNKDIWYFNGTNLINYGNGGYPAVDNSNFLGVATTVPNTPATVAFENNGMGELGALSIKLFGKTRYLFADSNLYTNAGSGKNANGYSFNVEDVTSLPVTISNAGFASLYSPVALTIPSGVTAYVGTSNNTSIDLTPIEGGIIPANTGVVLEGAAGTYEFAVTTGGSASSGLQGTVAAIAKPSNGTTFVLGVGTSNGKVGFYKYTGSTLGGFKAYLNEVTTSNQFLFNFVDDDPTAVNSAINGQILNGQYYDLQGRKVAAPQKGQLYIVNGKKVLY